MNTEQLKNHKGDKVVVDNNVLIDLLELSAALDYNYISILNQLFSKAIIPTPILEDEYIYDNLSCLNYIEGTLKTNLGFNSYIELANSDDSSAKRLSEYDRLVISVARERDLLAVSNDKPVREICKKYKIRVTGTLGIIISAYENQIIEFKQMEKSFKFLFSDKSSCYLSPSLKTEIYSHYNIK